MAPTIGFLVLAYRHRRYVDEFARRLRPQRHEFDRVLFVDNGGGDGSVEALRDAGVGEVLARTDGVLASALNEGIAAIGTDYVLLGSLDNLPKPDTGATVRRALALAPPDVAVVWGEADVIDDTGRIVQRAPPLPYRVWRPPFYGVLALAGLRQPSYNGVLLRREAALCVRYREADWVDDFGFTLRVAFRYPVAFSGMCWAEYRRHPGSWSEGAESMFEVASSATRFRIIDELWPEAGWRRSTARGLASYAASRLALGRRDPSDTVRFALESLHASPAVPVACHTLLRAVQGSRRG